MTRVSRGRGVIKAHRTDIKSVPHQNRRAGGGEEAVSEAGRQVKEAAVGVDTEGK